MVSSHADQRAYTQLLTSVRDAAERLAEAIVANPDVITVEGVSRETLLDAASAVVEEGFFPSFMMIDGDDAERNAIRAVFPHIPLRACQFHVMQACRSKARRAFDATSDPEANATRFLRAFRRCQRCPTREQWITYKDRLKAEIEEIAGDNGEIASRLMAYLQQTWFSGRWVEHVVDFGIPAHVTRDGPWSTNNYSEVAFRTFDRVFLCCRANKRYDNVLRQSRTSK